MATIKQESTVVIKGQQQLFKNNELQIVLEESVDLNAKKLRATLAATSVEKINLVDQGGNLARSTQLISLLSELYSKLKSIKFIFQLPGQWSMDASLGDVLKKIQAKGIKLDFVISTKREVEQFHASAEMIDFLKSMLQDRMSIFGRFEISPDNCLFADDYLLFCEAVGIKDILFYPTSGVSALAFEDTNRFHTAQFYKKLARFNSPDFTYSNFYNNLFLDYSESDLIKKGSKTTVKQMTSINGLGDFIETPIQDFDFTPSLKVSEIAQRGIKKVSGIIKNKIIPNKKINFDTGPISTPKISDPKAWKQVLITGWYGTETAGDKAILGEVLHFVKTCSPDCKIILTTIFDHVSLQTNLEMDDLKEVQLVDIKKAHLPTWVEKADAVIMGGGPLMESQSMIDVWRIFKEANRQQKARIVFGCGVGPIHTEEIKEVTISVLKMTTAGFVRDEESYHYAGRLYKDHVLKFACDPAVGFVSRWRKERLNPSHNGTTNRIVGLVRENTNEFVPNQSKTALFDFNTSIARKLANILEPACVSRNLTTDLLHMNAPWIGGDDRIFNRFLEQTFEQPSLIRTERKYLTLEELIQALHTAKVSMAMRYHGHIFSMALGIPFLSIDYTGKQGKVQSLVERIGYDQWSEKWENIDPIRATERLNKIIEERDHWSAYLLEQTDKLVGLLHATYQEVFNIDINKLSK